MSSIQWNINVNMGQINNLDKKLDALAANFGEKIRRAASYGIQILQMAMVYAERLAQSQQALAAINRINIGISFTAAQIQTANLIFQASAQMPTNPALGFFILAQAAAIEFNAIRLAVLNTQAITTEQRTKEYQAEIESLSETFQ